MQFPSINHKLYLALLVPLLAAVFVGSKVSGANEWPGFGREARYGSGGQFGLGMARADFNGDGVSDLAVGSVDFDHEVLISQVGVLLGQGDGTLGPATPYRLTTSPQNVAAGDLNGDGKADLVSTVATDGNSGGPTYGVDVLLGNGDGTFQAATFYALQGRPADVVVSDFNQDGRADVAVKLLDSFATPNVDESGIGVFLSGPSGHLLPATQYPLAAALVGLTAGDFDGDGQTDLATLLIPHASGPDYPSTVNVLPGRGDGTFAAPITSPGLSLPRFVSAAADFNGDGKLDLAVTYYRTVKGLVILLGNGDGTFVRGDDYPNLNIRSLTPADLDGDGFIDLALSVIAANGYSDVDVLPGQGDGTFRPPLEFPVAFDGNLLAVGEFNGDGKPDLALNNYSRPFVSVLLNSVFTPEPCQKPGTTILFTDPQGDARDGHPSHDIESVSLTETFAADGEPLLEFKLKVAGLQTIQPENYWVLSFNPRFNDTNSLRMRSSGGQISFVHYARAAVGGGLVSSSYDPDGTITFVVTRRSCDLLPGEEITGIEAFVYYQIAEGYEEFDYAPGTYPSHASYTLGGGDPCVPPTPTPTPSPTATPTPSPAPQLLTEENSDEAIALDSVTFMRSPFPLVTPYRLSADRRTRVMLFARDVELPPGDESSVVTAQAEDAQQKVYPLAVEYAGQVEGFDWLTQIVVRLPDDVGGSDKLWVSINVRGAGSNKALIKIIPAPHNSP